MDVLVHITNPDGANVAAPLMHALARAGASWGCFITNDGVQLLRNDSFIHALKGATRTVVCEHSWEKIGGTVEDCPIERGSQTINSAMMAEAQRVISL